jgi:hypothetical protein
MTSRKMVSFQAPLSFPLNGVRTREVLKHLKAFKLAVNEPEKYAAWLEYNKEVAADLEKLLEWSEACPL